MNLVVGSSGRLGGMVARKLVAHGKPVRVLVRQPTSVDGAESVTGDLKDRASLDRACRGVSTVITTATSAQRGGADNVDSVDLEGNRALIDAAGHAGIRQFVFVSAAFVDVNSSVPLFAAKARTESHLRESGLPWTIVAPHAFLDLWFELVIGSAIAADMPVSLVGGGRARHSWVAVDDVAEFATSVVDHPDAIGQRVVIGGPEAYSWRELAEMTSRILGKPVPVTSIEAGQPIATLPSPLDGLIGKLAATLEQQDVIIDASEAARRYGVSLTPAESVIKRVLTR